MMGETVHQAGATVTDGDEGDAQEQAWSESGRDSSYGWDYDRAEILRIEERAIQAAAAAAGQAPPTSSIFVRTRKRVRLRRTPQGLTPVYRLRDDAQPRQAVELCVGVASAADALAAAEGGASRIELEPSTGGELRAALIALTRCTASTQLFAHLATPNEDPRDWRLNDWGRSALRVDIAFAKGSGAAGVVVGALTEDGAVDADLVEKLVRQARPMKLYFARDALEAACTHSGRAFVVPLLCSLGVHGIYATFGDNAWAGRDAIADVVRLAHGRAVVVATGGITLANALRVAAASKVSHVYVPHMSQDRPPLEDAAASKKQRTRSSAPPAVEPNAYARPRPALPIFVPPSARAGTRSSSASR